MRDERQFQVELVPSALFQKGDEVIGEERAILGCITTPLVKLTSAGSARTLPIRSDPCVLRGELVTADAVGLGIIGCIDRLAT
jgi:hypothetical protein